MAKRESGWSTVMTVEDKENYAKGSRRARKIIGAVGALYYVLLLVALKADGASWLEVIAWGLLLGFLLSGIYVLWHAPRRTDFDHRGRRRW